MKAQLSIFIVLLLSSCALGQLNPCTGLWLGESVPNPIRCDAYYVCILTIPNARNCEPNHVFSPTRRQCEPGNPETCEIYSETTTTTTTTPAPPNPDEICEGVFFAARPYPDSYTLYVGCIRSMGTIMQCFEDEWFDPTINECLSTATTEPATTTTRVIITTQAPNIDGLCRGIFNEYVEHPTNCALFIFCYEEMEFLRQCPQFQIFHQESQSCRPGNQSTCEFSVATDIPTVPTVSTTQGPATEIPTLPTPPEVPSEQTTTVFNPCAGMQTGLVPDETNCSRYYRCVMERFILAQCANGQIFSNERQLCINGNPQTCTPTLL